MFAKESGYISKLFVDYGSHVKAGQVLATLEIPELQMQLDQDRAMAKSAAEQVTNAEHQLARLEAQHKVLHLEYERFQNVAESKPGLVAQQEVDEVQGRDLAAEAQVEAARSNIDSVKSNLAASQAKVGRDNALLAYARITAPFSGVVTQRYANLGMLLASGTNASTQSMALVKLSEMDRFRLVIPVSEEYVRYVRIDDPVRVLIPSLNRTFPGKVARFSSDIHDATRTMHTEVDVENPSGVLMPGLYAQATLTINRSGDALTVPIQAIDRSGEKISVDVVDASGRVQICPVVIGTETESEAEIVSGLNEGTKVIVSDRAGLNNGQEVTAHESAPVADTTKS